jgi:cyclopropane-fatty-acyl-phospholipid synthase
MNDTNRTASVPAEPSSRSEASLKAQPRAVADTSVDLAAGLLRRLFRNLEVPLSVRLWNGVTLRVGRAALERKEPRYALVFQNPRVVSELVLGRDPLAIAEAYFRGDIDVEGDFRAALGLRHHLAAIRLNLSDRIISLIDALRLRSCAAEALDARSEPLVQRGPAIKRHSKAENRDAIRFHYDLSNEFYALWLDAQLVYSCGYFESANASLETAQRAKLEHICRKLRLQPGESLLDIGCGWGALIVHAAQAYGVRAHGVTLSQRQYEFARRRIRDAGLEDRVTVELRDYRDIAGEACFDKITSVGMFEHVGLDNLPLYFGAVERLLKPCGLFLNHGITHEAHGADESLSTRFINRYVFPDGQLDTIGHIQSVMEDAHFEVLDVEGLRRHYALTLSAWVDLLERNHEEALRHVNEATYRVWRLYMSCCALEFDAGGIGVYQILAAKRGTASSALPLTRRHLYAGVQTEKRGSHSILSLQETTPCR